MGKSVRLLGLFDCWTVRLLGCWAVGGMEESMSGKLGEVAKRRNCETEKVHYHIKTSSDYADCTDFFAAQRQIPKAIMLKLFKVNILFLNA